jgi:hypothetical protein
MSSFAGLSPAFSPNGSHKTFVWDMTERFLTEWDPDYRANANNMATQYAYMSDYLQMGFAPIRSYIEPGSSKGGLATYAAFERWPLISSRVLALTAERAKAMSLLRDAREHSFPGSHPLMNPARAAEYAGVIAAFLQ